MIIPSHSFHFGPFTCFFISLFHMTDNCSMSSSLTIETTGETLSQRQQVSNLFFFLSLKLQNISRHWPVTDGPLCQSLEKTPEGCVNVYVCECVCVCVNVYVCECVCLPKWVSYSCDNQLFLLSWCCPWCELLRESLCLDFGLSSLFAFWLINFQLFFVLVICLLLISKLSWGLSSLWVLRD